MKRRQAVEPVIGHVKGDCRMRRCQLKGQLGDALHAVLCASGYNSRWLLRWIAAFCAFVLMRLPVLVTAWTSRMQFVAG